MGLGLLLLFVGLSYNAKLEKPFCFLFPRLSMPISPNLLSNISHMATKSVAGGERRLAALLVVRVGFLGEELSTWYAKVWWLVEVCCA